MIRIGGGLALLLLLAVERKICPGLLTPPPTSSKARGGTPAGNTPAPAESSTGSKQKPIPLSLQSVLPDAMPARWPAQASRGLLGDSKGRRGGWFACDSFDTPQSSTSDAAVAVLPPWAIWLWPTARLEIIQPAAGFAPARDPAVETVLLRTGPPCA